MYLSKAEYTLQLSSSEIFDLCFVLMRACEETAQTYHVLEDKAWTEWVIETKNMRMLETLAGLIGRIDMYQSALSTIAKTYTERKEKEKKQGGGTA